MFNHSAFDNSRVQGMGWIEIVSALASQSRSVPLFVPLRKSELEGVVWGPLASLRLTQVYFYQRQECDQAVEAVYRFPLPGDAAITGVTVDFGDVHIIAQLAERTQARREYEAAHRNGHSAALLCKEGASVFTLHVTGLQPDQAVTVTTAFVLLARCEGTGWQMRFPLTVAPRYSREDERGLPQSAATPLLVAYDPGHHFEMQLMFAGAMNVESPSHHIDLNEVQHGWKASLPSPGVIPDRDLILQWKPCQEPERTLMQVITHQGKDADIDFLAVITPPAAKEAVKPLPRDVMVLVDHSGSMDGSKREAADWTVRKFLGDLQEFDRFNLCVFDDQSRWFHTCPVPGSNSYVQAAMEFLTSQRDGGGTELGVALEQAMQMKADIKGVSRHILIITDAQVTDEGRLIQLARQGYEHGQKCRTSLVCIDSSPNDFLVRSIAAAGGGVARFVTANPQEGDIATSLDEILTGWNAPLCSSLRLDINQSDVFIAGRDTVANKLSQRGQGIDLGDLPAGQSVWIAGKIVGPAGHDIVFTLTSGENQILGTLSLDHSASFQSNPAVGCLFSAWRLMALEQLSKSHYKPEVIEAELKAMGYTDDDIKAGRSMLYQENQARQSKDILKRFLVAESLASGLICMETAWLGIRQEKGQKVEATVQVANALPAAWEEPGGSMFAMNLGVDLGPDISSWSTGGHSIMNMFASGIKSFLNGPESLDVPCFMRAPSRKAHRKQKQIQVYQGRPSVQYDQLIYDSLQDEAHGRLPEDFRITRMEIEISGDSGFYRQTELWIYADDLFQPMATIGINDLIKQGGQRPLSLIKPAYASLRIIMVMPDPSAVPSQEERPELTITLYYK